MVYTALFILTIGTSVYANWYFDLSNNVLGIVGCLTYIVPFLLIPLARPIERVCIESAEARRRHKGLPIQVMPSPKSERLFRRAVYIVLAMAFALFFFGFWLIGHLYHGVD